MNTNLFSTQRDMIWSAFLTIALFAGIMLVPDMASAAAAPGQGDQAVGGALCTLVTWINGTTGRAIATLAIIVIGVGALMGKISWGMAIIVALGIAIVFGATSIVTELSTNSGNAAGANC